VRVPHPLLSPRFRRPGPGPGPGLGPGPRSQCLAV